MQCLNSLWYRATERKMKVVSHVEYHWDALLWEYESQVRAAVDCIQTSKRGWTGGMGRHRIKKDRQRLKESD